MISKLFRVLVIILLIVIIAILLDATDILAQAYALEYGEAPESIFQGAEGEDNKLKSFLILVTLFNACLIAFSFLTAERLRWTIREGKRECDRIIAEIQSTALLSPEAKDAVRRIESNVEGIRALIREMEGKRHAGLGDNGREEEGDRVRGERGQRDELCDEEHMEAGRVAGQEEKADAGPLLQGISSDGEVHA